MKKTEHFQLNQWEKTDRILMDDFNADNAKIDAALAENKSAIESAETACMNAIETAVAPLGNCKVVTGTYTGTGTYNKEATAVKLNLGARPVLMLIYGDGYGAVIINMADGFAFYNTADTRSLGCHYDNGICYWLSGGSASAQLNSSGATYTYYAFFM